MSKSNSEHLEAALRYLERGWSVIPVHLLAVTGKDKAEKRPLIKWKEFQQRRPTREEVIGWWNQYPEAHVGIVTGTISKLVVIDLDIGYNEKQVTDMCIPPTLVATTPSGGQHMYLITDKITKTTAGLFGPDSHVDIRGEGGYVVAPPSTYPDGRSYVYDTDFLQTNIAELPEHLEPLLSKFEEAKHEKIDMSGVSEGSRNTKAAHIVGTLFKQISPDKWEEEAWRKLVEWNETNSPPLDLGELRNVYDSIKSRESQNQPSAVIINVSSIGNSISLKTLMNREYTDPQWSVEQFFETGSLNMISAAPHQYKSWIAFHFAIAIASGTPVFGHFPVTKQAVLIVNEEDTERSLQERAKSLQASEDLEIYFHVSKGIKLDEPFVSNLLTEINEKNIKFLIFDSLRSVHDGNENDSQEMQKVMDQLKRFYTLGITVLFTHHNRKKSRNPGAPKDQNGAEESRGSSSINAAIHSHITCEPRVDGLNSVLIISQHKLKCAPKMDPFRVLINNEKDKNTMGFEYQGTYNGNLENKSHITFMILEKLEEGKWLSIKVLEELEIASVKTIRSVIAQLATNGDVIIKTRKQILAENLPFSGKTTGSSNEFFYHLSPRNEVPISQDPGY